MESWVPAILIYAPPSATERRFTRQMVSSEAECRLMGRSRPRGAWTRLTSALANYQIEWACTPANPKRH